MLYWLQPEVPSSSKPSKSEKRAETRMLEFEDVPGIATESGAYKKASKSVKKGKTKDTVDSKHSAPPLDFVPRILSFLFSLVTLENTVLPNTFSPQSTAIAMNIAESIAAKFPQNRDVAALERHLRSLRDSAQDVDYQIWQSVGQRQFIQRQIASLENAQVDAKKD